MSFKIKTSGQFEKELKRLSKKYPSLKKEYIVLLEQLKKNPTSGAPLGNNMFKARLAIASKGKGKSGGARVITYVQIDENTVLLLSIYNKGDKDSISDKEIQELLKRYG